MSETLQRAALARLRPDHAPWPRAAHQRRSSAGAETTPATTTSSTMSPISVAHTGTPRTKFLVPSIGSITHRRALWPDAPNSSPSTASRGLERDSVPLIRSSIVRSASVTGVRSGFVSTWRSIALKRSSDTASAASASVWANRTSSPKSGVVIATPAPYLPTSARARVRRTLAELGAGNRTWQAWTRGGTPTRRRPDAADRGVRCRPTSATRQRAAVFRAFFVQGRLQTMPAKRAKRLVVLDHIARVFEPGVRYAETDVNAFLPRVPPRLRHGAALSRRRGIPRARSRRLLAHRRRRRRLTGLALTAEAPSEATRCATLAACSVGARPGRCGRGHRRCLDRVGQPGARARLAGDRRLRRAARDAAGELSPAEEAEVIDAATPVPDRRPPFEPRIWVLTAGPGRRDPRGVDRRSRRGLRHRGVGRTRELTINFVVLAVTTDTDVLTGETVPLVRRRDARRAWIEQLTRHPVRRDQSRAQRR